MNPIRFQIVVKEDTVSQTASLCLRNFDTGEDLMIGERPAVAMVDMGLLAVITDNGNGRLAKRLDAIEERLAALETEANATRCDKCNKVLNGGDYVLTVNDGVMHAECYGDPENEGSPWPG